MRRDELIGRTIANRFRISRVLGEGGMATVFVAEQDAEPRQVALKILHAELSNDRTFAKRFEREASAAKRVQHPNSVTIFDAGVEGALSYIAMELLHGDDLYTLLERHQVLSPRAAAKIVVEVCEALAVAHGLGIVHRDLKPENIMVVPAPGAPAAPNGPPLPAGARVKVLDFGIAKLLERPVGPGRRDSDLDPPSAVTAVTRVGTLIGTPAYMSPEQCSLLPVDTRSDIYTCGVLLFQMVTGRLPFDGTSPLHIATKHIHLEPPPLRSVIPEADPALEALILKTLAKKPGDRHPTARHLGTSLRKLLPTLPDVPYALPDEPTLEPASSSSSSSSSSSGFAAKELSIDSLSSLAIPEAMASAKTIVADGAGGQPGSVVLHGGERPRGAGIEAEPDDLVETLVIGEDDFETHDVAPGGLIDRQITMHSAPGVVPPERAVPARISVVDPPPLPPSRAGSSPENLAYAPTQPGLSPSFVPLPVSSSIPEMPSQSVIVAPSLSAVSLPVPPAASLLPSQQSAVAAPTFGLPRTEPLPSLILAQPQGGKALWLGIAIGAVLSAVLFALAYLLLLSH